MYCPYWFFGVQRDLGLGVVAEFNYLGSAGRNLYNAYNINRFVGDLLDGSFNGFNPSFQQINMVTSKLISAPSGRSRAMTFGTSWRCLASGKCRSSTTAPA